MGPMKLDQSLKIAYSGICQRFVNQSRSRSNHSPQGIDTRTTLQTRRYQSGMPLVYESVSTCDGVERGAHVTYRMSKHHSVTPGWLRSSPDEIRVPVVGSRRAVPIFSRYRERKSAGR